MYLCFFSTQANSARKKKLVEYKNNQPLKGIVKKITLHWPCWEASWQWSRASKICILKECHYFEFLTHLAIGSKEKESENYLDSMYYPLDIGSTFTFESSNFTPCLQGACFTCYIETFACTHLLDTVLIPHIVNRENTSPESRGW